MKKVRVFLTVLVGVMALSLTSAEAAVLVGQPAPDFTLTDTQGQKHSLSDYKGKYVVLEWVNYECPFVKKHYQSGNMQQLQKKVAEKDVVWLSINSSAEGKQGYYQSSEVNQIMVNADAHPKAYLFDTNGDVGRIYEAKTTPHMFIVNPQGELIYQGAIDSIASFDQADVPRAQNYVLTALSEAMEGKAVSQTSTKSYGCSVKY